MLKVGVDESPAPPLCFGLPGSPTFRGFEVDMMQYIARHLHLCLKWQSLSWHDAPEAVVRGELDVLCTAVTITSERRRQLDFSDPYLQSALVVVTPREAATATGFLTGRRVGVREGTVAEEFARQWVQPGHVVTFDLNEVAYEFLASGRVDAVIDDFAIAHYFGRECHDFRVSGPLPGTRARYALALARDRGALRSGLNVALAALRAEGMWHKLMTRWQVATPAW